MAAQKENKIMSPMGPYYERRPGGLYEMMLKKIAPFSSSDAGMEWDIHPKNKKQIGTRLGLSARGHVYGEKLLCDPPEFLNAKRVPEGILINFRYGDGLHIKGDKVNALVIRSADDKEIAPAEIIVVENGLLITGNIPENSTISFARTAYYEVNIYNKEDNPAKPFEITV